MENSKQPAYPTELIGTKGEFRKSQPERFKGLTKHEYIIIEAMQAMITGIYSSVESYNSFKYGAAKEGLSIADKISENAIIHADSLLKALEKKENEKAD